MQRGKVGHPHSPAQCRVTWVRNSRPESLTSQQWLHRRFCSTGRSSGAGGRFREAQRTHVLLLPRPTPRLPCALGRPVTSEEQLGVGVQVAAAGGPRRAQEPPERGLEGLLQNLGGQSGAAGPGEPSARPVRPQCPCPCPFPGRKMGRGITGLRFHVAEASGSSRAGLSDGRGEVGRRPCQEPHSSGDAISAPRHEELPGHVCLKAPGAWAPSSHSPHSAWGGQSLYTLQGQAQPWGFENKCVCRKHQTPLSTGAPGSRSPLLLRTREKPVPPCYPRPAPPALNSATPGPGPNLAVA